MVEHLFKKLTLVLVVFSALLLTALIIILNKKSDKGGNGHASSSSEIVVTKKHFGSINDSDLVYKYSIKNVNTNFEFEVLSYGATLRAVYIKDRNRYLTNVVLGFNTLEEYMNQTLNPYFGSIVGRVSNRISNGKFELDGVVYNLDKNNGQNYLHGGFKGLSWRNWNSMIIKNGVKFYLTSPDGDQGFPGLMYIEVSYTLSESSNSIVIEYRANTTRETPIDLTNHAYFNLGGHYSRERIYNHLLKIYADYYLDYDPESVLVTGRVNSVKNTKYDFRQYFKLSERIRENGSWPTDGYDSYFISNQASGNRIIASVINPQNGIRLDVYSNQNGAMFYTGNFLDIVKPSDRHVYSIHQGFCVETSNYPDAVNHDSFPSSILKPEAEYHQRTVFKFSLDN